MVNREDSHSLQSNLKGVHSTKVNKLESATDDQKLELNQIEQYLVRTETETQT